MTNGLASYDSVTELVETLDRQVRFYLELADDRLLIGLPQLLLFFEGDSRQFTQLSELREQSQRALKDFESQGRELRASLAEIWEEGKRLLLAARALPDTDEFSDYDDFDGFERNLTRDEEIDSKAFLISQ